MLFCHVVITGCACTFVTCTLIVFGFVHRSPDMIFAGVQIWSWVAIVFVSEPSATRAVCAEPHMHLAESAAPSGGSRLQSSVNFESRN